MKIGFFVGDLSHISGGMNVILEYANGLARLGAKVELIVKDQTQNNQNPVWHSKLVDIEIVQLSVCQDRSYDILFATWWMTVFDLGRVDSQIYAYLNQSLESRFHPEPSLKFLNRLTYSHPLLFLTEAKWLQEFIQQINRDAKVIYLQNGLSRQNFPPAKDIIPAVDRLRILVEGPAGVPYKGVRDAFAALEQSASVLNLQIGWLTSDSRGERPQVAGRPIQIFEKVPISEVHTVYRRFDVLLKLSSVEGMFGPPLEMFSQGGTAITSNVSGSDEYMVHGLNGFVVQPYNYASIAKYLKILSEDKSVLDQLKKNALKTAQNFPDWSHQSAALFTELEKLVNSGWSNRSLRKHLQIQILTREPWVYNKQLPFEVPLLGEQYQGVLRLYHRILSWPGTRLLKAVVPMRLWKFFRRKLVEGAS